MSDNSLFDRLKAKVRNNGTVSWLGQKIDNNEQISWLRTKVDNNRPISWVRSKMGVPDLVKLFFEIFTWRKLLLNRITIVLFIIVIAFSGSTLYVSANSNGVIEGTVVTEDGEPVENADITLRTATFGAVSQSVSTTTDSDGYFRFDDEVIENTNSDVNLHQVMEFRIIVERNGTELGQKRFHQLFRGQQRTLDITVASDG
jgi:hypothetical protein